MWIWKIKQDEMTVARGRSSDKEIAMSEACRYLMAFGTERCNKMTVYIYLEKSDD